MFEVLRQKIDQVDKQLMSLISERFALAQEIGEIKKEKGMKVFDPDREKLIKERLFKIAEEQKLNKEFISELYELIFQESRRLQG